MKRINHILNILSLTAGSAACLIACLSTASSDAGRVMEERPLVSAMTVSPETPAQVTFCGATLDLTRYNRHESMDRELNSFTYFHSTTMLLLKRANRYFPVIEPILKANGVPDDFKYLAVIESHLDPGAVSPARAAGMWQFMESTAKEYKLTVASGIDERYHVTRSTEAACRYLKDAYAKYGDWTMVAASYNAGMGRISSEHVLQQVDSALDLWVVEETARYVYRMLAVKQIFENPYKYGFVLNAKNLYKPIAYDEVSVTEDIPDLAAYAGEHGVMLSDLKRFNLWLRDVKLVTGGKTFVLQIPRKEELHYDAPNDIVHDPRWIVR